VLCVPNGVAHGTQVNVFQPDVIVSQVNDFARNGIRFFRGGGFFRFFFITDDGGPVRVLGRVVIAIARALRIGAQNGAYPRQRGVQLGVFIDHVRVPIIAR